MEQWEYRIVSGALNTEKRPGQEFLGTLNDLGRQGWEAVGMEGGNLLTAVVLLKRRVGVEG